MSNYSNEQPEPILTFDGKRYNINNLPNELKEIVKGLQISDNQLRLYEDTLKVLAIGRQSLAKQLNEKLKDIDPIP
ncbi:MULTISPECIES: DUF6447 family protein [Prochlorococcus]|uniref:Uncharacterized protein n=1 Tax=Prochlorococcus marinus (strain SARG / CCMP1375 / SS120) TaxID=167539 RepID=Q7VC44_PROMA|nr:MULTISPECIES: DUF6447 family protein [Prochlorococcus]AAP99942.1 Predicted protein [Prochlorococcus marinus subsp. marinus str. CCMP1375]KGG11713.1 hypothetical protein EV04_0737 [Prochlorococcus marinus str. LG]KGG18874.1 hypothetical protein EV08_1361 [Prochlorococcus marinus str. SS2]KGG32176.1 hypothetical protein EV10_1291 [Prochlorococcus marinus str. SS51]KGG35133.1 hypothetical protein EV11_1535 [Prochlorococcus sp. SS52]